MIEIRKDVGERFLELGGGDNPSPQSDIRVDVRQGPHTHFTQDFNQTLDGIGSDEFDAVLSFYCVEHISWRNVPQFLAECRRVAKPGGRLVLTLPNTEAQMEWIRQHPNGWDGKGLFESAGGVLYGDNDYPENSHRAFFTPVLIDNELQKAGWVNILVQPYGARGTDLLVTAEKPTAVQTVMANLRQGAEAIGLAIPKEGEPLTEEERLIIHGNPDVSKPTGVITVHANADGSTTAVQTVPELPAPEVLYDRHYFNGGANWGGYAREGYWDFPCHAITARHILNRKPESVLELGAARGYIGKRLEDAGVRYTGLEVSRHCYLTRVSENVLQHDLLKTPWPVADQSHETCFSAAVLEHIPEQHLPALLAEMTRTCQRGLHGIDFGERDDGFDRSHATLNPRQWWVETFAKYAPGWPVEIVDKEDLERGQFPEDVRKGDGKIKLNVGSCQTMFHHGWQNLDVLDLGPWAQQYGYQFVRCDLRAGLPYQTGTVDLLFAHHVLEHLSYEEGLQFLRDCRRVLKPGGAMRLAVPNAKVLIGKYLQRELGDFDELNETCAKTDFQAAKYWELLHSGHAAAYDTYTLKHQLEAAGFVTFKGSFRQTEVAAVKQVLAETVEYDYGGISLFMDAVPLLG